MNNRLLAVVLLVLITLLGCRSPHLDITDGLAYNFGKIYAGDTLKHTFVLKNSGSVPLVIEDIKAACFCTVTHLDKKSITPNSLAKLRVEFISRKEELGFVDKQIILRTNAIPKLTLLHIKGIVRPPHSPI